MKAKKRILIVDDVLLNIKILEIQLMDNYEIVKAYNGKDALKLANSAEKPDLILLDIMMPDMDGYEVCRKLKSNEQTKHIPVVFLTALSDTEDEEKGLSIGAIDFIRKPSKKAILNVRIKNYIELADHQNNLKKMVDLRTKEVKETQFEILLRLSSAVEYRDNETGKHLERMSRYCVIIGRECGMDDEACENFFYSSLMHDVGKVAIPDRILLKPGKLDADEWEQMKNHTTIGARLLSKHSSQLLKMARDIALTHHEKWNGTGYPQGLSGLDIPLEGRITSICDVFDALTSKRPYKKAWAIEDAVEEIKKQKGIQFDPDIVDKFLKRLPEIVEVSKLFSD